MNRYLLALVWLGLTPAFAQSDNVTRCYVRGASGVLIVRNGQTSAPQCRALAVRCTGNPNAMSTFTMTPTIIHQAFEICGEL